MHSLKRRQRKSQERGQLGSKDGTPHRYHTDSRSPSPDHGGPVPIASGAGVSDPFMALPQAVSQREQTARETYLPI